MNPLSCVIVTTLYCLGIICEGQGFFVSQDETKWNESRCTLAEPMVICSDDDSSVVKNGLEVLKNAKEKDNGFWIGYAKTWISNAYVGCEELDGGAEYSVPTLGECRRTTGCKTFGIQKLTTGLRCKCSSENALRTQTCGETCKEGDKYPCGDTADTNIFSVYTVENVPPSEHSQNNTRNCLLFYYKYENGNDYYWESCNLKLTPRLLCSNKYFSDNGTYPPLTSAYVELINQTFYVNFANKNDMRKSLCTGDGTSTGPPTTSQETQPTSSELNTAPAKSTTGPTSHMTPTNNVITTDTHSTEAPVLNASTMPISHPVPEGTAASIDKDEEGSTAGAAAGVSVSLVLLIIVTIIVLIFMKRRGLLTKCNKQNDEKSNHTEDTATEIACISTPIFESTTNTMDDLTVTNHSYFVLEKTFDEETKEDTDHYAEPDTTDVDHYDLTDESQKDTDIDYDTADDKNSSAKSELSKPNNSYNKVTLHQTNEYDHINGRPPKSDRQTENEYDISNNLMDCKCNNNFGDDSDTYNHLNKHESKSSGTDNVYGKSETDGDSGYYTSSALTLHRNMDENDQQTDYDVIKKKW
ncbi:uncharacterized protein LOC128220301 isoform X2 [Mya arenaria]|uniref:uncharacterized protein LOC128220301 isoform X2 n=1 Tax=Mya arenaria TaxID=6604 RepID=UPI0022DF75F8|nr:uncharacterized protein LOC128220301 isoform X2 [Mya arenaria]